MHKTEEEAARQYDRALIIVKGCHAKTNFPVGDYDREIEAYEQELWCRFVLEFGRQRVSQSVLCSYNGVSLAAHITNKSLLCSELVSGI